MYRSWWFNWCRLSRVVNVSSSVGHLQRVPGTELRNTLSSSSLTEEELDILMKNFVTSVTVYCFLVIRICWSLLTEWLWNQVDQICNFFKFPGILIILYYFYSFFYYFYSFLQFFYTTYLHRVGLHFFIILLDDFSIVKSILFFVNWISLNFSISYKIPPKYFYCYCILIR